MSDGAAVPAGERSPETAAPATRRRPDRLSVALFSLAAFLLVLALLGAQLGDAAASHPQRRVLLVRRIYTTTVSETVLAAGRGGPGGGTSVTQSVTGASPAAPAIAPITRTS